MADVTLDFQFSSSVEQVWKALTDSDMLSFRSEPNEWVRVV